LIRVADECIAPRRLEHVCLDIAQGTSVPNAFSACSDTTTSERSISDGGRPHTVGSPSSTDLSLAQGNLADAIRVSWPSRLVRANHQFHQDQLEAQ
jgi:hypothetical protein